jgi:hypothetical protein
MLQSFSRPSVTITALNAWWMACSSSAGSGSGVPPEGGAEGEEGRMQILS